MNDDLDFVRARVPDYREYGDESARHDSDMRVRAFVGQRLSLLQTELDGTVDGETKKTLEDVLYRCMFTDQVFIRKFEHARLDPPMVAALVKSDRVLLELADAAGRAAGSELRPILIDLDKQFEYRRAPAPVLS